MSSNRNKEPPGSAALAGAGMTIVSTLIAGFALGWMASKFLHWDWAVPVGVLLGFVAGFVSLFRQLSARM